MLIGHDLSLQVKRALQDAQAAGDLPAFDIPEVRIEHPRQMSHGDYATPTPLELARLVRMAPVKIARIVAKYLTPLDYVDQVEVAPPGFINFRLADTWLQQLVDRILVEENQFGGIDLGKGKKVQVEFVSANPTGPITLHRTRGGVIGDTLANALEVAGYTVVREYYYNDAGRQIILLGESVKRRYQQLLGHEVELSDEHYPGQYIVDIAQRLIDEHGDTLGEKDENFFADYAKALMMDWQRASLKQINIVHNVYFNENDLYTSGRLWEALEVLRQRGYVYQTDDGAQWFRTTAFGDEKDRVLIRSIDGRPTYRLPDIAYHWDKAQRGFDRVIDIFGPDHHAVASQVLMGVQALGYETDFVHTLLHQTVSLIRGGQAVKMSTRKGVYVTLDELIAAVGADPIRYFMLSRSQDSPIEFDLDLAVEKSEKNPVYYIQNAHVRCAGILRKWVEAGYDVDMAQKGDLSLLTHENELNFLRRAHRLPEVIELIVTQFEPHHLVFYTYELAIALHLVYETCRVLHPDVPEPLRLARLRFYLAAKTLLARLLGLMGMTAPEVM
jgi:arginyl-tRNA synthetase